jgi:hypothetical protein
MKNALFRSRTELGALLAEHKKHAASDRWVFTNADGKPDGPFLRRFKVIANPRRLISTKENQRQCDRRTV